MKRTAPPIGAQTLFKIIFTLALFSIFFFLFGYVSVRKYLKKETLIVTSKHSPPGGRVLAPSLTICPYSKATLMARRPRQYDNHIHSNFISRNVRCSASILPVISADLKDHVHWLEIRAVLWSKRQQNRFRLPGALQRTARLFGAYVWLLVSIDTLY